MVGVLHLPNNEFRMRTKQALVLWASINYNKLSAIYLCYGRVIFYFADGVDVAKDSSNDTLRYTISAKRSFHSTIDVYNPNA